MPLTESAIKAAKPGPKRIKLPDGGGLYMLLTPTGRRSSFLTYRHGGRSKTLPLGGFPAVSLTAARPAREQAKLALAEGGDPGAPDAPPPVPTAPPCRTLREAAEEWLKVAGAGWKESHRERVESRLRMNVYPPLGARRLDEIQAPDVLAAVRQVEARGAMDISRRTVQAVAAIFRFSIASGWVKHNPAADLRGALGKRSRVRHHAMVAPKDMGGFLVKLAAYDGEELTRLALEAVVRTAVRTSELRFGTWSEIEGDLWRIPSERMKVEGVEHLVPLPPQVKRLLKRARELGKGRLGYSRASAGSP